LFGGWYGGGGGGMVCDVHRGRGYYVLWIRWPDMMPPGVVTKNLVTTLDLG